jgi:hypothetical protein
LANNLANFDGIAEPAPALFWSPNYGQSNLQRHLDLLV